MVMVMLANTSGWKTRGLAKKYPGKVGNLFSPDAQRGPWEDSPYALDNGAFPPWEKGQEWDYDAWAKLIDWANKQTMRPMWTLVPDVVANAEATKASWFKHKDKALELKVPLAIAVQDGMKPSDLPDDAEVLFVGGTLDWKWASLRTWCETGRRVHVGRVNTLGGLDRCRELGVESCDGTGWLRGNQRQWHRLLLFMEEQGSPCLFG